MDDLLKQLGAQAGPGGTPKSETDPLGGLGDLLGSGGLGSILGGALGGGVGGTMGGGLGGLLGGGLGAMLPTLLPAILGMLGGQGGQGQTGLHQLVDGMRAKGLGGVADSWVGTGENQPISATEVQEALGDEKLQQLSADSGLPTAQVAEGLAAILPGLVNHLTPNGQVPAAGDVASTVEGLLGRLAPR